MAVWIQRKQETDVVLSRPGKIGKDAWYSDVHEITTTTNSNGSGPGAFGGAQEWPVVTATVSFQAGEEERAKAFAEKIKKLVDEEFKNG